MKSGQMLSIVILLAVCYFVNIEGGRRGFGKRFSKPSKGSAKASVKDTTSEPEHAKDSNTTNADLQKCKTFDMKLSEKGQTHLKDCAAASGIASKKDITPEKIPCFSKCIFEHKKLVDEAGKPHKENVMNIFSEAVPDNMKETLKTSLGKCLDDHGLVDPTDPTCQTYTPLAMCVHLAVGEVCKME